MQASCGQQSGHGSTAALIALLLVLAAIWGWFTQGSSQPADAHAPAAVQNTAATALADAGAHVPPGEPPPAAASLASIRRAALPAEARHTLRLIEQGGPFPFARDGMVFGNHEGRLPQQPRGYYREYTVITPGIRHRGARRIVSGKLDQAEYYYTADHYHSFSRILP